MRRCRWSFRRDTSITRLVVARRASDHRRRCRVVRRRLNVGRATRQDRERVNGTATRWVLMALFAESRRRRAACRVPWRENIAAVRLPRVGRATRPTLAL